MRVPHEHEPSWPPQPHPVPAVSAAAEANSEFTWSGVYSKVSGDLPIAELPKFSVWADTAPQSVVRFQLDVTTAGAAKLKFNSVAGLTVYVGNAPVEPKAETVLDLKTGVQTVTVLIDRSKRTDDVRVSFADLVVLAGNAAVEKAAADAGVQVEVVFHPGRTDATQEQTDVASFAFLEPKADGFRNYVSRDTAAIPAEHLLLDKANLLTLTAPEMTVLVGGQRALGANWDGSEYGVFTERPGVLSNDVFMNLLDLGTTWKPLDPGSHAFEGRKDGSDELVGRGTRVDLLFGSNSELRALAEVYASDDANEKFVRDFAAAWGKVTELDRFDLHA